MSHWKSLAAYYTSSNVAELRMDASTHSLQTLSYEHHEVHSGSSFVAFVYDSDFDKSDEINICFDTPAGTKWIHLAVLADCSVPSELEILEGPTITNGSGTPFTVINRNRNSDNESILLDIEAAPTANTVSLNCTITADGTVIHGEAMGTGKKSLGSGGGRDLLEYVLLPSTRYAVRIAGTGITDNGVADIKLTWYEHTDKN